MDEDELGYVEPTIGIDLLSVIIQTRSNMAFDRLNYDWFKYEKSEVRLYKLIKKYLNKYASLPTLDICKKYGCMVSYPLGDIDNDTTHDMLVDHYLGIVNSRYTKNVVKDLIRKDGLLDTFKGKLQHIVMTSDSFDDIDIVGELKLLTDSLATKFDSGRNDQIAFTFEEEYDKFTKNQYENRFRQDDLGILTPYDPMNLATGGWKAGEWVIETGNVKEGKSWIWEYFIYYMNQYGGHPTCIASMEMPNQDQRSTSGVFIRMMALIGQLSPQLIRSGKLPDQSLDRIDKYVKEYRTGETVYDNGSTAPMIFYDATQNRSLKAFEQFQADNKFELSCVDSIYLAKSQSRSNNKWDIESALVDERMDMINKHGCIGFDTHQLIKTNTQEKGVDSSTVAGSAAWGRNADLLFAIRGFGDDDSKREIVEIASRHGKAFESFIINFILDPRPDFSIVTGMDNNTYEDIIDDDNVS